MGPGNIHPYGIIIPASFVIGLVAGVVMHRADYCIAGMFRDLFLFRNGAMLRTLLVLAVVSMSLFEVFRLVGLLPLYPFPVLGSPSLSNIIGGVVFGIGMVLAGGCVVGTLYKMGAGSVLSFVAFLGLLVGSGLYAEVHPAWAAFSKATGFLKGRITLPDALGVQSVIVIAPLVVAGFALIARWGRRGRLVRASHARGYLQPWKAAVVLAFLGLLSWVFVGMPMGITTAYAKVAAFAENSVAPEHVAKLTFFGAVPLNYTHPLTGAVVTGGAGPRFDGIAAIQFPLIVGIVLGAALSAHVVREFRPYFRVPPRQYVSALIGGVLLGLASRMTPSCNVWHLLGGLPILALQSIFFFFGLLPGAWLGSMILKKGVLRL